MNNQFSPKISEVLIYSKEEAIRLHNDCVAPEHLLLGLIREGEGKAIQILRLLNLDFKSVKLRAEQSVQNASANGTDNSAKIILSEKAAKIMAHEPITIPRLSRPIIVRETASLAPEEIPMMSGEASLEDMLKQMKMVQRLGSLGSIASLIPGMPKLSDADKERGRIT